MAENKKIPNESFQIKEGLSDWQEHDNHLPNPPFLEPALKRKEKDKTRRETSGQLLSTSEFTNDFSLERKIYSWYERAMERRDREPLDEDAFLRHFFEGGSTEPTFVFGDTRRGYLLGTVQFGVFIPSHFAPRTLSGGYRLIKELGESDKIPAIMAITSDLRKTITKLACWRHFNASFLAPFRGGNESESDNQNVIKEIVYNSHPRVKRFGLKLLREYLKQQKDFNSEN